MLGQGITVKQETKQGTVAFYLEGRLDGLNASDVHEYLLDELGKLHKNGDNVIVNFEGLKYISSAGIRTMLVVAKHIRKRDGECVFCALTPHVNKVFQISGLDNILKIYPDEAKALTACASGEKGSGA